MKIAILASGEGENTLYLYDFFKEGNRVETDCLITDNPDSSVAKAMKAEGVDIIKLDEDNDEEIVSRLKDHNVEMLVEDGYTWKIPESLKSAYADSIVTLTEKERGPLDIIEAVNRKNASPVSNTLSQNSATNDKDTRTDLEKEWAETLKIDVPKHEIHQAPPAEEKPISTNPHPDALAQAQPQAQPVNAAQNPEQTVQPEPMPKTYLVWSVIITLLFSMIPGIIAIIYSANVSSRYYKGNIEGAKRASRYAQIWCIVSILFGIVWTTLYVPLSLLL